MKSYSSRAQICKFKVFLEHSSFCPFSLLNEKLFFICIDFSEWVHQLVLNTLWHQTQTLQAPLHVLHHKRWVSLACTLLRGCYYSLAGCGCWCVPCTWGKGHGWVSLTLSLRSPTGETLIIHIAALKTVLKIFTHSISRCPGQVMHRKESRNKFFHNHICVALADVNSVLR